MFRGVCKRFLTEFLLNVKVETIENSVTKGTGTVVVSLRGAKSVVKKLGKLNTVLAAADGVVAVPAWVVAPDTTDAEKDLDALGLAVGNILGNRIATLKKARLAAVLVVPFSTAVGSKVGTGVASAVAVLGRNVDKGQRDVVRAFVAAIPESVGTICFTILALQMLVSKLLSFLKNCFIASYSPSSR